MSIFSSIVQKGKKGFEAVKSFAEDTPLTPFASADKLSTADAFRFGKSILQGISRNVVRVGAATQDVISEADDIPNALQSYIKTGKLPEREGKVTDITPEAIGLGSSEFEKKLFKAIFGTERVSGFAEAVAKKEIEHPELAERKLVVPFALAATVMDFTGFGGGKNGLIRLLTNATDPVVVRRLLQKAGMSDDFIRTVADDFVNAKTTEEVKQLLNTFEGTIKSTKKALGLTGKEGSKKTVKESAEEIAEKSKQIIKGLVSRKVSVDDLTPGESVVDITKRTLKDRVERVTSGVKERGFITSVKEAPQISDETKQIVEGLPTDQRIYDVYTDESAIARATERVSTSQDEALSFVLQSKYLDKDVATTGIELMRRYRIAGNVQMEAEIAGNLAEKATRAGQGIQALSILNKLSPEGILVYAQKRIISGVPKDKIINLDRATKDLVEGLQNASKGTAEYVVKEAIEKAITPQERSALESIVKSVLDGEDSGEKLAKRITDHLKAPKPNDPIKEMIQTLYKVAQEVLPKKQRAVPKDPMELIGQAINDKEAYKEVWEQAQEIVKGKFADQPQMLELLEDYFGKVVGRPFALKQVEAGVSRGIKDLGINLAKVVKEHYSKVAQTRKSLVDELVQRAGIPEEQAAKLAPYIEKRFDELVKVKRDQVIKSVFKEVKITEKPLVDRIIELSNLGAFDSATYRPLIAKKLGIPSLSERLGKKLIAQAENIEKLPFGYQKYKATKDMMEMISREIPTTKGDKAWEFAQELLNLPRSVMSSFFDFSFTLRQGIVALARHPKDFARAFTSQFKPFLSEGNYEALMDTVMKNKDFQIATNAGVGFSDINAKLLAREERYMSSLAEKIPILGIPVRATNRAYTAMANKLRMDTFATTLKNMEDAGLDPRNNPELMKNIASLVNDMTGRGDLPDAIKGAQSVLNAFFFSPRLIASRINLLNPFGVGNGYIFQSAPIRKEYVKTMLSFGTMVTTTLGLAHVAGMEVGLDPRSSDFGKIKIGNTRFDVAGGFQQYLRMATQFVTGKYVSSTTGKIITLGEGYKPLNRYEIALRFFENKEAPIFSFLTEWAKQQDPAGEDFSFGKAIGERLTPMFLSDMWDLYQEDPSLLPSGFLSMLGVGVQSYAPPEAYQKLEEIESSEDPDAAWFALKESNPTLAQKVERAGIESSFNEFDWSLTYMGVENGRRAKFLVERFNRLESDEERNALWDDLESKKLLSKKVAEQINYIWANPDSINTIK